MKTQFLLASNLDGLGLLLFIIFFIGFGIPIILLILGLIFKSKNKKNTAKVLLIIAGVYLLISLGICGSLWVGF